MIPQPAPGERGWRVNPDTGVVHLRYADHALNVVKVATVKGAESVLNGKPAIACKACFPHGNRQKPNVIAQRGQKRRT